MTHHDIIQALMQIQAARTQYDTPNAKQCGLDEITLRYLVENEFVLVTSETDPSFPDYWEEAAIARLLPRSLALLVRPL